MTLKHMRIFITVYQEGNVTRAAQVLHMTQPAVSRSIQELESYYGIRLFERINHRLYRTESGTELYAYALHIIDSFDSLEKGMKNWDELGVLRIGASITIGNVILPPVVCAFQKLHPDLRVKVTISNSAQLQQALLDSKIDLALIEGAVFSEHLSTGLLTQDHLCLILPNEHPLSQASSLSVRDLTEYPLLLREKGSAGRSYLDHIFAAHGFQIEPVWESASTQALVKAVSAGLGISILPQLLVQDAIASGLITTRSVTDESFIRQNYIVWHRQKFLTRTAREFMEVCRSSITEQTGGQNLPI